MKFLRNTVTVCLAEEPAANALKEGTSLMDMSSQLANNILDCEGKMFGISVSVIFQTFPEQKNSVSKIFLISFILWVPRIHLLVVLEALFK